MSARSRPPQMQGSMGSSWDDAEYSSDADTSIHTASDPESGLDSGIENDAAYDSSDKDFVQEHTDKATPLVSRNARRHSSTQTHATPPQTPDQTAPRHSQIASSTSARRSTTLSRAKSQFTEPSFIMPRASVNGSPSTLASGFVDSTPVRNSQIRSRKQRQPSLRNAPNASPKDPNRRSAKSIQNPNQREPIGPWHYVNLVYQHVAKPLFAYFWDLFSYANRHFLKPILGVILGVAIIVFGLQLASSLVYSRVSSALEPICLLPFSSHVFSMCGRVPQSNHADFEELIHVQERFEDILDASQDVSTLPATIKDSELAIRDLRTLVRYSRLPSRNQLDLEFHNFVLTANEASIDLSRYNSRIGATMDRVIATNTWTMAVLQGLEEKEASIGAVGRFFNAMTANFVSPSPTLQQRIFDQYLKHVSQNKEEITRLIETAQALLQVLQNLDERLDTIHSISTNDDQTITKNQDELLSYLWTKLGGNSASVKSNAKQLNLLGNISAYRKKALKHVSETLLKLQEIQAELENLRDGVAAPEVLGWRSGVPISYHVDLIEKGVDRLRLARGESMRVEGETYRNRIKNSEASGGIRELPAGQNTPVVTVKAK
ncbi:hypothetical protein GQ44DRAFT_702176 [Phaeosphaeriaceae sp. PMI808]|nr:hypothetical protein GQ44DRAFT_702176 [Phaeosphaeriaceae sp. PMI808]